MKEQIQQLIAAGQTKDALHLLVQMNPDALLLQAQYNNGEKQFNLGLIDFGEWGRIQARVNFAALEMATSSSQKNTKPADTSIDIALTATSGRNHKVFISYSWNDKQVALKVKKFLEDGNCQVTIDEEDIEAAQSINGFIRESIKQNHFIISVVSQHSLSSGWVGRESTATFFAEWLADKQFIPVRLDNSFNDPRFYVTTLRSIEEKIKELDGLIVETQSYRADTAPLDLERKKQLDLKANLGDILQKLKSINTVDISGDNFEQGMQRVLSRIVKS